MNVCAASIGRGVENRYLTKGRSITPPSGVRGMEHGGKERGMGGRRQMFQKRASVKLRDIRLMSDSDKSAVSLKRARAEFHVRKWRSFVT